MNRKEKKPLCIQTTTDREHDEIEEEDFGAQKTFFLSPLAAARDLVTNLQVEF